MRKFAEELDSGEAVDVIYLGFRNERLKFMGLTTLETKRTGVDMLRDL